MTSVSPCGPTRNHRTPRVDLDDTRRCPADAGCATCGAVDDLAVSTAETPVGILCLTLCSSCRDADDLPRFPSWTATVEHVIAHCGHLGIDTDAAAAIRRGHCPACQASTVLDLGRGARECTTCGHSFHR